MSAGGQPLGASDEPQPFCPTCKHLLTPATDVLYQGISFGAKYSIIYCGGAVPYWAGVPPLRFTSWARRRDAARFSVALAQESTRLELDDFPTL